MIARPKKKNKKTRNRFTGLENELMVTRWEEKWGGIHWEFQIDMYTLLYLKIDDQQGPTIYHRELCSIFCNSLNEKKNLKNNRYMYMYNNHSAVHLKLTPHC